MERSELAEKVFARIRDVAGEQVALTQEADVLRIEPKAAGSFPIFVQDGVEELVVAAGGWHTHFSDSEEAFNCVMGLLTPFYRIVQTERGGRVAKARLELFEPPGQWARMDEIGILFGGFGRKTTTVLQQNVLSAPPDYLTQFRPGAIGADGFPQDNESL